MASLSRHDHTSSNLIQEYSQDPIDESLPSDGGVSHLNLSRTTSERRFGGREQ
ncbi:hypothetical protein PanWU01x14_188590, partial [Parasponia andersonii]